MKMRTNFHKFSVNSRTIDIKFGGIGAIFMGLQPIHQLSNTLLGKGGVFSSKFLTDYPAQNVFNGFFFC